MIELPPNVVPNGADFALVDRGGTMRGASALRVNRLGSHYKASFSLPPLPAEIGKVVVSRLLRAKIFGLRLEVPLLGVDQGEPRQAVVNGAGQSGRVLQVQGAPADWIAREGFWISVVDPSGQHYLHNVRATSTATNDGRIAIAIEPELRFPFPNGAAVHLARPMIEGAIEGDEMGWNLSLAGNIGISFTIEEAR